MKSRYGVSLNMKPLNTIHSKLIILDVEYGEPDISTATIRNGGNDGARVGRRYKESAKVTVTFELHIYDIIERQAVRQDVVAWAKNGGMLEINDRPGQRLRCICEEYPTVASVRNWTDPLKIVFAAYENPYWEAKSETTLTLTGTSATGTLDLPGSCGNARVSVEATAGASVTSMNVTVGSTIIKLSGLSVSSGQKIQIGYTDDQKIYIRANNVSVLAKRSADSSDELLAPSGEQTAVAITADGAVSAVFSARGCWM